MEIVIKLSEEEYKSVLRSIDMFKANNWRGVVVWDAIRDGIVLPERHGRLKDIDAFINKVEADRQHAAYTRSWTADDVLNALDKTYAPTVVEAEFQLTDTERSFLSKVQNDISRINKLSKSKQKYGKHVGE